MREEFVTVYRGMSVDDAQKLADRLKAAGIEAFADHTESPLYGASLGPRGRIVRVRQPVAERAREVVRKFEKEGHPSVSEEEWAREETGLELGGEQRPSEDSPSAGAAESTETASKALPGPEAPEGVEVSQGSGERLGGNAPRNQEVEADVERPEVEERPIDELDVSDLFSQRARRKKNEREA